MVRSLAPPYVDLSSWTQLPDALFPRREIGGIMEREAQWKGSEVTNALRVVLVGAVLILVGVVAFSVVADYWNADGESAKAAVIGSERVPFAAAFGLQGLATVVIGSGLFLLGRAITPIETRAGSGGRAMAARFAGWFGIVVGLSGLSGGLHAIFATPEFYVHSVIGSVFLFAGGLGLVVSVVVFGVLSWAASPPKWTAVILTIGGLVAVAGLVDIVYVAMIIYAIANLFVLRSGAVTVPARSPAP